MLNFPRTILMPAVAILICLVLDIVIPMAVNGYIQILMINSGINIILAVSLNLVNGFTGQFSIGHAGFMAVGAYFSAYFSVNYGANVAATLGGGKLGWAVALALATMIGAA